MNMKYILNSFTTKSHNRLKLKFFSKIDAEIFLILIKQEKNTTVLFKFQMS